MVHQPVAARVMSALHNPRLLPRRPQLHKQPRHLRRSIDKLRQDHRQIEGLQEIQHHLLGLLQLQHQLRQHQ